MQNENEGGCQCGAIRYRLKESPISLAVCHCSECQRQSGSAFGMSLTVPVEAFELRCGEPKTFARSADSGRRVNCFFCGDCGTRIYHAPEFLGNNLNIKPGTLDDTSGLVPKLHVWTRSKQPWVSIPDDVPRFETQP